MPFSLDNGTPAKRPFVGAFPLGLVLLLGACTSEGNALGIDGGAADGSGNNGATGGQGGTGGSGTAGPDCNALATGLCGAIDRCAHLWLEAIYGDLATCIARARISCDYDIAVPDTGVTAASVQTCTGALVGVSCADLLENRFDACDTAGPRANGAICSANSQCQSALCNRTGACGTCAAKALAGETCSNDNDDQCASGLVCAEGSNRRCATPGASGSNCGAESPCGFGLYCKNRVCAKQAGAGEPCQGENSCNGLAGLYCNEGARVCQIAGRADPGERCGLVDGKFVYCVGGSECRGGLLAGVCATPAKDGEACGARADGRKCLEPATCVEGLCRLPSAAMCQ